MKEFFKHLKIIGTHRSYVRKACFKMGLFWQGLTHDLSKYSITELKICKYYTGKRSPHQVAREELGYSPSWIHHYHTNKHHHMFWIDETETGKIIPMKMPYKYVIESFCDMLGASKAYNPDNWKPEMLLNYWETKCVGKRIMHPASTALVDFLINLLCRHGEEYFFEYLYPGYKDNLVALYEQGGDSDYETMRKLFGLTSKVG
jgi:hypothetical protein